MELAVQLERRGARLELEWCPREPNQEADDLSNLKTGAFRPELRIDFDPLELPFIVLPKLMRDGSGFYSEVRAAKEGAGSAHRRERRLSGRESLGRNTRERGALCSWRDGEGRARGLLR
eukprot:10837757-Heterocapsa_arctica.AAC.1